MDIDRVQRRDIDKIESNTVSLTIDELKNINTVSIDLLSTNVVANNWYRDDYLVCKELVTHNDKVVFNVLNNVNYSQKNISKVNLVGVISSNNILLKTIGLGTKYKSYEIVIDELTDIDEELDISEFNQDELNSLFCDKGFDISLTFDYEKSSNPLIIEELQLVVEFEDKLQGEKEAIMNRVNVNEIIDTIYPIGSIYMSVSDIDPSLIFGGTWEKIEDKFLLGSGNYELGDAGGEETHTLTVEEMPSHKHTQAQHRHNLNRNFSDGSGGSTNAYTVSADRLTSAKYTDYQTPTINNTGGGLAHNNMPPYIVVNIWKRSE